MLSCLCTERNAQAQEGNLHFWLCFIFACVIFISQNSANTSLNGAWFCMYCTKFIILLIYSSLVLKQPVVQYLGFKANIWPHTCTYMYYSNFVRFSKFWLYFSIPKLYINQNQHLVKSIMVMRKIELKFEIYSHCAYSIVIDHTIKEKHNQYVHQLKARSICYGSPTKWGYTGSYLGYSYSGFYKDGLEKNSHDEKFMRSEPILKAEYSFKNT